MLSVVIITYNESNNIEACIRSVLPIADEVLVVDSFSKDDTVQKAEALGARCIQHAFEGHIEQKNWAKDQAQGQWILSLDADERLTPELADSIVHAMQNPTANGFTMNRLNNYCGKFIRHGAWYPDRKLRLWKKGAGAWGGTNPHDRFILHHNAPSAHIQGDLLHYSYRTLEEHAQKTTYFAQIAAQAYFAKGKRGYWFNLWLNPLFRGVRDYVFKRGFLDGIAGLHIVRFTMREVYLKYKLLIQLQK